MVVILNQINIGSTANFDKAIGMCQGDIIALCDQDDVWRPGRLLETERLFVRSPDITMVFGDADIINDHSERMGRTLWQATRFSRMQRARFRFNQGFECLLNHNVATGATMAFTSAMRRLVSPIPAGWVHDHWIALICSSVSKVAVIEKPLIEYRTHAKQQIGAADQPRISSRLSCPRERTLIYCAEQIAACKMLQSRLEHIGVAPKYIALCEDKMRHLNHRASISHSLPGKTASIVIELTRKRYHRYSNGFLTAARDFIIN